MKKEALWRLSSDSPHLIKVGLGSEVGSEGEAVSGQKEMINKHLCLRQAAAGRTGPGAEERDI